MHVKIKCGAREPALSVNFLHCKREDLSSDPHHSCKTLFVVAQVDDPSAVGMEIGGLPKLASQQV